MFTEPENETKTPVEVDKLQGNIVFDKVSFRYKKEKDDEEIEQNDDKKDEDDQDGKKEEETKPTEPPKPSDEELIVGTWTCRFDLGDAFDKQMLEQGITQEMLPDLPFYMDIEFVFDNETLTMKPVVDEESFVAYLKATMENSIDAMCQSQGVSKELLDSVFQSQYNMTVDEYINEEVRKTMADDPLDLGDEIATVYYRVDAENGRIYASEEKEDLAETKQCIEYSIVDGNLLVKKFIDDDGTESEAPLDLKDIGIVLPWEFTKK